MSDPSNVSRPSVFPGFADLADERRGLVERLVAGRLEQGLSQTEVAARMGTSQSAVARLERGDVDVRLSTVQRYAAALDHRVAFDLHATDRQGGRS